ncbi:MAG: transporter [Nocardioidaceae bacterium]|nr:transporter [Nocardioidaceae bacterium]
MKTTEKRTNYQVTFAVLAIGVLAYALLQSLVIPVMPTLEAALHSTQTNVTWVLTAYLLSASISTPIVGRLGDMRGKKRMFVFALLALALGSLIAALATSLMVMVIGRVIQGIGGGVIPLAFGIIRDEFPGEKVPGAVGIIAALTAVGAGIGTVLGGPIVDALSYHWLFWFPLILTLIAAVGAFLYVPESEVRTQGKVNWLAALLLSAWLIALLLAVSKSSTWGWGSSKVLGLFAVAAVAVILWILVETKSVNPLVDMKMMRVRAVWTTNLVAFLFGMAMYSTFAFLPALIQTPSSAGYGFSASITESGFMLLPSSITMFVMGMLTGRMAERFGSKRILIVGSLITMGSLATFAFAHDSKWELYLASAIFGVGFGMAFAAISNLIVAAVPPEQTGVASGMNANIRTIGGSIGAALMASVVAAGVLPGELPEESGYTNGFLLMTVAIGASVLVALFIPAIVRNKTTHHEPHVELRHPEMAAVAGGTVVGDEPE